MGTGYTRNDTPNNIADGNVINASDLDGEFDAIQAAFNNSTGHSHDGTTGEGPQIDTGGIADSAVTTAKINNDAVTLGTKTSGNYVATGAVSGVGLSGSASAEGATFTVTSNATSANTASTIVARDASGDFSAGTITAALTGTASNAALLDSLDSTQFLRSDAADTKTSGDLSFSDNVKANFGAGNDLQIYHDGLQSYITDTGTGSLRVRAEDFILQNADGSNAFLYADAPNGAVLLYHNGNQKFQTTSTGIDVTGTITFDGGTTSADLNFGDNDKAIFGAGSDLQIYHDGSNSYIKDGGTGELRFELTDIGRFRNGTTFETLLYLDSDAGVTAYYNGAAKLETTNTGIDVTGTVTADGLTVDASSVRSIRTQLDTRSDSNASVVCVEPSANNLRNLDVEGQQVQLCTNAFDQTASLVRLRAATNGDILFYADDGTTTGLFWDASTQRLGLGTTSPATALDLAGEINFTGLTSSFPSPSQPRLYRSGSSAGSYPFDNFGHLVIQARGDGSNRDIVFATGTAGANKTVITSGGNVGINNASPQAPLHIIDGNGSVSGATYRTATPLVLENNGNTELQFFSNSSNDAQIRFGDGDSNFAGAIEYKHGSDAMLFYTGATERMRIDSSGNVGIGGSPVLSSSAYNAASLHLRQPGSTTTGGQLRFTTGASGHTASDGAFISYFSDNNLFYNNQESGDHRFFNGGSEKMRIQSGGGISFNGDTAAANALDDYEEGTFTATLNGSSTTSDPRKTTTGYYTKIGNLVHVNFNFNNEDTTGYSGQISVFGLPFTAQSGVRQVGTMGAYQMASFSAAVGSIFAHINGGTELHLLGVRSGNSWEDINHSAGTARYLQVSLTYKV